MMKSNLSLKIIVVLMLTCGLSNAAVNPKEFEEANQKYEQGKYDEARALYESIVKSRNYSSDLFYNLGNACFRLGEMGAAILNYERALALDASHPEAKANLAYLRNQTGAKLISKKWIDFILLKIGINSYVLSGLISAWLILFSLVAMYLGMRERHRRFWINTAVMSFVIFAYSISAIYQLDKINARAIIISKQAEARFAPADTSTLAATLPAGSHLQVLHDRGPWINCVLPDNRRAWVPSSALERIRPS